ncbi:MAG TPA: cytochrome c [Vicinamibacterales bacterium]|nr:cytochrome c [Vicinamibacterales bacterium]
MSRFRLFTRVVPLVFACAAGPADLRGQPPDNPLWRGVYTAAQAERGKALYVRHCSRCHGDDLGGRRDYPLSGERFMERWEARTLEHLFVLIRTSMPPDGVNTVDSNDKRDIVAYLLQQNGFPAGTSELPHDTAVLATFAIERSSGRTAPRTGSLVRVTGCLTLRDEQAWTLINATEPERTALRTPAEAGPPPSAAASGTREVRLMNVFPNPAPHRGHMVAATGFLMGTADGDAINVVSLDMVAPSCPP